MPKNNEIINDELFRMLRSKGYDPVMLDSSAKQVPVPEEAEVFQFKFVKDGTDYGTVTVSIDGLHNVSVYYNDAIANSPKGTEQDGDPSWYSLIKQISRWAKNYQLSFELKDESQLKHDMAKRQKLKTLEESYHPMGKKASWSDNVPNTKILIQHNRSLEEGEQRFRNIAKIYVENAQGERFLLDTNRPGLARVHARNVSEGGTPYDERGKHISSLITEYSQMAGFVRATKGRQYNESVNQLVESGHQHYLSLRETLHKLSSKKGYSQYFESWTPTLNEDTIGQPDLAEMFKNDSLDPRIEAALSIISRFAPKKSEMSEVAEFADWAENPLEKTVDETIAGTFGGRRKKYGPPTTRFAEPDDEATPPEEVERMRAKNPKLTQALDDLGKQFMDKYPNLRDVKENDDEHPLYHQHQQLRKQHGLPDPDYYLKLKKQKQAEIDALRKEIEADKAKQGVKEEQKDGDYVMGKEKAKSIGHVIGAKPKQHPFKGRLVGGGVSESNDPLASIKKLSGLEK